MEKLYLEKNSGSKMPARLDFLQSASGLLLGLFMFGHLFFLSAILFGEDAAFFVDKQLEGAFLDETGHGFPILVTISATIIFILFFMHALLAMRKFPHNWREYRELQKHMHGMHHEDTNHWFWQAITGFVLFFFGSAHLFNMMMEPEQIGPFASADRMWSDYMWTFYTVLLIAFVLHGVIGLYRLSVKWGWFEFGHPKESRKKLKKLKKILAALLLILGLSTIAKYSFIGFEHQDRVGERYIPDSQIVDAQTEAQTEAIQSDENSQGTLMIELPEKAKPDTETTSENP